VRRANDLIFLRFARAARRRPRSLLSRGAPTAPSFRLFLLASLAPPLSLASLTPPPAQRTGIEQAEMELVLQSLSLGKKTEGASTRVLTRVRSGDQKQDKTVLLTDEFVVNRKFRNNLHKVKIPQIANKLEEEAEEKKAHVRNPYPRPPPRASPH
jgi:hypothetical protein